MQWSRALLNMARQALKPEAMIPTPKPPRGKTGKRTVSQILREAYALHCRDRDTRHAVREQLASEGGERD